MQMGDTSKAIEKWKLFWSLLGIEDDKHNEKINK